MASTAWKLKDKFGFGFAFAFNTTINTAPVSEWFNMGLANHSTFVLLFGPMANTCAISLQQATSAGGAGAKVLPFTEIGLCAAPATSTVLVTTTVSANSYTLAATAQQLVTIDLDSNDGNLDADNGFNYVQVVLGTAAGSTLAAGLWIGSGLRYGNRSDNMPIFNT